MCRMTHFDLNETDAESIVYQVFQSEACCFEDQGIKLEIPQSSICNFCRVWENKEESLKPYTLVQV